jgi:hypothetical protein
MLAVHQRGVLVGLRGERERAVACDCDEDPAGAEDASAGGIELLLQLLEPTQVAVDRSGEITGRLAARSAHDLPETGVVGVPASVPVCTRRVAPFAHRAFPGDRVDPDAFSVQKEQTLRGEAGPHDSAVPA